MQEASSTRPILSVRDLSVRFRLRGQSLHAIRGVSLDVYPGESLALVGESGCGKSVLNKNFIGLLDNNGYIDQGQIRYYAMNGMPSAPDGALYKPTRKAACTRTWPPSSGKRIGSRSAARRSAW